MRLLPLVLALVLPACAYKVELTSVPTGATLELPDGTRALAPETVTLRWAPFNAQRVRAVAPGYRPLTVDLRRREVRVTRYVRQALLRPGTWFGEPRGQVELVLVPDHGPTGTWTPSSEPALGD